VAFSRHLVQHRKALKDSQSHAVRLYSQRHTFLTRLGASGCDVWTLMRIAGRSSISISSRYVQPQDDVVLAAVERIAVPSRDNLGTIEEMSLRDFLPEIAEPGINIGETW